MAALCLLAQSTPLPWGRRPIHVFSISLLSVNSISPSEPHFGYLGALARVGEDLLFYYLPAQHLNCLLPPSAAYCLRAHAQ